MSIDAAGFGATFAEDVEREAANCGETVEFYIQRAIAARLVADMARRGDPSHDALVTRLADAGLTVSPLLADTQADEVLADPNRLAAVRRTGLLDSAPNPGLDRIVCMAAEALGTPSAALSLLEHDQLVILSSSGPIDPSATSRRLPIGRSMAKFAVTTGQPLMVEDASRDPLFKDLPSVKDRTVIGYLGIPVVDADGYALGTLAVWDRRPRRWSSGHVDTLQSFVSLVWQRASGSRRTRES